MSQALATVLKSEEDKLLACVHCGLCLEACPTYVATGDENDSPRGRIYLMRAVEEKRLAAEAAAFQNHIDRCLGCRACESACPAGVEYGQLLEAARSLISQTRKQRGPASSFLRFMLKHVWLKPGRLRLTFRFARFIRDLGVPRLLLKTKFAREVSPQFEFALALLDSSRDRKREPKNDANDQPKGPRESGAASVDLFKSCVTEGLFERVNDATMRVLEVNGSTVAMPEGQVCCGALHAHAGELEGARMLARRNIKAFERGGDRPVITNAGGCGAMLASYGHLLADDAAYATAAANFSARVRDVGQQLEAIGFRNGAAIGRELTTYDASCHLLHGQHAAESSLQMLWAVPELNFKLLKESDVCCGGAGVYNLLEPELSDQVLAEKLEHLKQSGAEVLATGNAGCHMQIAAGARLTGMKLRVCHPVELLDESYRRAGLYAESEGRVSQNEVSII